MTTVVAAILEEDQKILICQRRPDAPHALKWEFPGGKVEPGETPREALARELREELGIEARIGRELDHYEYSYLGKSPILLIFFFIDGYERTIENRIFQQVAWAKPAELSSYDFLEGDLAFLRDLPSRLTSKA